MKFFIDTANLDEIKEGVALGLVDGVTTNPSLIAKENKPFEKIIADICAVVDGPVSAEVVSLDAEGMVAEGKKLAEISPKVVIKLPMTTEGLKACREFASLGIKTNVTLIFSAAQALLAAKAGATYVSPFVGRLDDIGQDGMDLIAEIVTIFDNYAMASEIIVASVRSPEHVKNSALLGADIATIPLKTIKQLAKHPLTDRGLEQFLADWENRNK